MSFDVIINKIIEKLVFVLFFWGVGKPFRDLGRSLWTRYVPLVVRCGYQSHPIWCIAAWRFVGGLRWLCQCIRRVWPSSFPLVALFSSGSWLSPRFLAMRCVVGGILIRQGFSRASLWHQVRLFVATSVCNVGFLDFIDLAFALTSLLALSPRIAHRVTSGAKQICE